MTKRKNDLETMADCLTTFTTLPWDKQEPALASPSAEAAKPVARCPVVSEELVEQAWCSLVNMDDRTSPEEYPDMALIKYDELREIIAGFAALSQPQGELREVREAIEIERAKVSGDDGYNYAAGQEYGLRLALIKIDAALAGRAAG